MRTVYSLLNASDRVDGYTAAVFMKDYEYELLVKLMSEKCGVCDLERGHYDHNCDHKDHEFKSIAPKLEMALITADWKDINGAFESAHQALESLGINHIVLDTQSDQYAIVIANQPITNKQAMTAWRGDDDDEDEQETEDALCSQCSLPRDQCVNPEHCNEELPDGMHPFSPAEASAYQGIQNLPNGSRPLVGNVKYDGQEAEVLIGCDDQRAIRVTLILDNDRMFDRVFKDQGKAQALYVMMRELGAHNMFFDEAQIDILGLEKAN